VPVFGRCQAAGVISCDLSPENPLEEVKGDAAPAAKRGGEVGQPAGRRCAGIGAGRLENRTS